MNSKHFVTHLTVLFGIINTAFSEASDLSVSTSFANAFPGESLNISCSSSGAYEDISWTGPDGSIIGDSEKDDIYTLPENGGVKLVLRSIRQVDQGVFLCHKLSYSSEESKAFFTLKVSGPPIFDVSFEVVEVKKGSNVTLYCEASGDPSPDYTWLDPSSNEITNGYRNGIDRIEARSSHLYIYDVTERSNGYFTCRANNSHGLESKTFHVIVHDNKTDDYRPFFVESVQRVYKEMGHYFSLYCEAKGVPRPLYTWYDNHGKMMNDSGLYKRIDFENYDNSSTLYIYDLKREDAGNYTCVARNYMGAANKTFVVVVSEIKDNYPPFFNTSMETLYVEPGNSIRILCEANGVPTPVYRWYDRYGDLRIVSNKSRIEHYEGRSALYLFNLTSDESQSYLCFAANYLGRANKTFNVYVGNETGGNDYPPYFLNDFERFHVKSGYSVKLVCSARGIPRPTYKWYDKYGRTMNASDNSNKSAVVNYKDWSTLFLSSLTPEDGGNYTCIARNYRGEDRKIFNVSVSNGGEDPFGDATIVYIGIREINYTSVTFDLKARDMSNFTGFKTRYRYRRYFQWQTNTKIWKYGERYGIDSLVPGATYYFAFSVHPAENDSWTDEVNVTLPLLPPEIIFQEISDASIKIDVFRTVDVISSEAIDHYRLLYKTISMIRGQSWDYTGKCEVAITIPGSCMNGFRVTGLQQRSYYRFIVQSHNVKGYSEPTEFKVYLK